MRTRLSIAATITGAKGRGAEGCGMRSMAASPAGLDAARWVPVRYLNLFRLVVAGIFLVAGRGLSLGESAPILYSGTALAYLLAVLALGFPDAARRLGLQRLITIQVVIDIAVLTIIMWASGGYRSGMPVLIMVVLAGAGLVAEGRMVLFYAALATVAVLGENLWRYVADAQPAGSLQVAITCSAFFAIALAARFLALRATHNESLAAERGAALAKQEAVNERIIRDMQDGVLVLGADGRVRQANPRAGTLLGVDVREGVKLADIDESFMPWATACGGEQGRVLRLGPAGRLLRCRAVRPDAAAEGDTDTLIYLTDYDEILRQIQQLKLAALGRLTAGMAHEIRNPLSAVTQAAELLLEEKRGDMQARLIRIINDNGRRIERMVREVLAVGRRDQTLPEAVPLLPLVTEIIEERTLPDGAEREVFRVMVEPDVTLALDRAHLHQIVSNLLDNARRHSSGGAGAVEIRAERLAAGRVALHVSDDGSGVAEAERHKIFEPFFTTHPKGTGLGLYIARELAEANGATLELADGGPGAHFVLAGRNTP